MEFWEKGINILKQTTTFWYYFYFSISWEERKSFSVAFKPFTSRICFDKCVYTEIMCFFLYLVYIGRQTQNDKFDKTLKSILTTVKTTLLFYVHVFYEKLNVDRKYFISKYLNNNYNIYSYCIHKCKIFKTKYNVLNHVPNIWMAIYIYVYYGSYI